MSPPRYFAPLGHRDFALLWSGQAVSQLGDGVFTVTLALEALRVDPDAAGLSYVLAARLAPAVLFTLLGGVIVDRFPRRAALLASDAAQGVAVTTITILGATHRISLLSLVLMALVFGLGDALFFPAATAITPELVPGDQLTGASALNQTSTQLARVLIGPALGGVIAGLLGTAWGFGIDAASFAVSTVTLMMMRKRPARQPNRQPDRGVPRGPSVPVLGAMAVDHHARRGSGELRRLLTPWSAGPVARQERPAW
jgi:MFS family permease